MLKFVLGLIWCFQLSLASPQAKLIDELYRIDPSRYSDDLWDDARLDVPELVQKYGYPCERHSVVTSDGYILGIHRIPYAPGLENVSNKPVVLLWHGLTSGSSDWVIMGHDLSLGYILAREGYDVWLGNARGNYYSRQHTVLNPDKDKREFWDFTWHEIGTLDLPAVIDYILELTGQSALHYIGHSQGTTIFFVMASSLPEYNSKIRSMNALAPVAYMKNFQHPIMTPMAQYVDPIWSLVNLLGVQELAPQLDTVSWAAYALCGDGNEGLESGCHLIGSIMLNPNNFNMSLVAVILGHSPAGASWKQAGHYGQCIVSEDFKRWDYGPRANVLHYRSIIPPAYNLSLITAPVGIHYSPKDIFTPNENVFRLRDELANVVMDNFIDDDDFSHINFVWAMDKKNLHEKVLEVIKRF